MRGFEFLSALRSHPKDDVIPVVIVSTCAFKNELQRCFALGISGYFTNPLKYEYCINTVTSLLGDSQKTYLLYSKQSVKSNFN
ncbi:MAG: CheY-like chemotaxis protein [Polaribacter sp.]|jgi:CheY-like chemotaxis protein